MKYVINFNNSFKADKLGMAGRASIDINDEAISITGVRQKLGLPKTLFLLSSCALGIYLMVSLNLNNTVFHAMIGGVAGSVCYTMFKQSTVTFDRTTVEDLKRDKKTIQFKAVEQDNDSSVKIRFKAKTEEEAIAIEQALAC